MQERPTNTEEVLDISDLPYIDQFEAKLKALEPYPYPEKIARKFETDVVGIYPEKLTSAILWHTNGGFEILLSSNIQSGYNEMDHQRILDEYNLSDNLRDFRMSIFIESGESRYLISDHLEFLNSNERKEIIRTLQRYGVSIVFSSSLKPRLRDFRTLKPNETTSICTGDYTEAIDNLIFNDWTKQIAKTYGLTVNEWIRFRLNNELPDK